jgi:hypothetical protein
MNLKFTKELKSEQYPTDFVPKKLLRLYQVWEGNKLWGQFFHYPEKHFFKVEDKEVSIEVISKWFQKCKYLLNDDMENKLIGKYEIFNMRMIPFLAYEPLPPDASVTINDKLYYFRRLNPDIPSDLIKQETWGHFKFRLYAIKGNEYADYCLKMDIPIISKPNYTNNRPFTGTIETNIEDKLTILSALYLMEFAFKEEDQKDA